MAFMAFDPYSEFFTPQEFPVEILNIAKNHDVIPCCLPPPAKNFLAFMLFKEYYYSRSNSLSVFIHDEIENTDGNATTGIPTESGTELPKTTKMPLPTSTKRSSSSFPFEALFPIPIVTLEHAKDYVERKGDKQPVLICSRQVFIDLIHEDSPYFDPKVVTNLNLLVISNVHEALTCSQVRRDLGKLLRKVRVWNLDRAQLNKTEIRTVFLTISLLHFYGHEANGFWRMEETFRKLEKFCKAKVDTTSDIVALLRYSIPPTERIILVGPHLRSELSVKLSLEVKGMVEDFKRFLNSHNYNPAASLGYTLNEFEELIKVKVPGTELLLLEDGEEGDETDSLAEELRRIPHPKTAPLEVLREFEHILDTMGPWCASRAIFLLNNKLAGMKVQVPYVRHFILLGALHTRLLWIQGIFHEAFEDLKPLEVLENFSTPKLMGVLRVLRRFDLAKPHESKGQGHGAVHVEDDADEEENSDVELTVADYLEQQKQVEQQAAATRGGRFHGRRKHFRSKFDVEKHKRKGGDTVSSSNVSNSTDLEGPKVNGIENLEGQPEKVEDSKSRVMNPQPIRQTRRTRFAQRSEDTLCGLLICEDRNNARLLYHFLNEASEVDPKLVGLCPVITVPLNPEYDPESPEAEVEHKKREESLRKFRYREANFLIGTSLLEDVIELPKANLVIRFDEATSFRSHLLSKGRAQGYDPEYYLFTGDSEKSQCLRQLSTYKIVEEILLANTILPGPICPTKKYTKSEVEEEVIKNFPQYKTATLLNSISIINRYCARLPSDSFTRLAPSWKVTTVSAKDECAEGLSTLRQFLKEEQFLCTIRLPINSPVKWPLTGIPMPTEKLAKKVVALQAVIALHRNGELDENLVPIGKEGVNPVLDLEIGEDILDEVYGEFRPGSTRRRQYYDKQLSPELLHCLAKPSKPLFLYWLKMTLMCPLPEDQNTRGRKLYPPEIAAQGFGILLAKPVPSIPSFPIYTRCGEVLVELVRVSTSSVDYISESQIEKLSFFHHYTFTSVLRLNKYLTLFDPEASENSYFVVPLKCISKTEGGSTESVEMDWDFVNRIWNEKDIGRPLNISNQDRQNYKYDQEIYMDAVVTPWYRNTDQPQFFYVAEICTHLTPLSQFPGCEFKTFEEYYLRKYNLSIHDPNQPLLDVDHTSARLNFLTPRYVNRKGLPLPTSSEATKRAKRENLEQKQILVPELCAVHPFSGSLWRQAVCLPCILYRVNNLLLANSIRTLVATQVYGLGMTSVPATFQWPTMSFGWSLQEVFGIEPTTNKSPPVKSVTKPKPIPIIKRGFKGRDYQRSKDNDQRSEMPADKQPNGDVYPTIPLPDQKEKGTKNGMTKGPEVNEEKELSGFEKAAKEATPAGVTLAESLLLNDKKHVGKSLNEILSEKMKQCRLPELEIGTWSNDMASGGTYSEPEYDEDEDELLDPNVALPSNLMMLDKNWTWGGRSKLFNHRVHRALYGSPTHWGEVWDRGAFEPPEDLDNHKRSGNGQDDDNVSVTSDLSGSDESYLDGDNNLKIQFEGNTAEAMDKRKTGQNFDLQAVEDWAASEDLWWAMDGIQDDNDHIQKHEDKSDDNENYETSFEEEKLLREKFEQRVEERMNGIQQVVNWDQINEIPPRTPKKFFVQDDLTVNGQAETSALDELLSRTTLTPPVVQLEETGPYFEHINESLANVLRRSEEFSFDFSPSLDTHCGPSPSKILQALTMSNANDGQNLERLETIGDSFLKYAITSYLFCTYENIHEGKLSHLRSKQVSNIHLYRLGRRRGLGGAMVSSKFEANDNWLPPCYHIPKALDKALINSQMESGTVNFSMAQVNALKDLSSTEMEQALKNQTVKPDSEFVPYNLLTQQSIPDKSIADCVEALIGAFLTSAGPQGALLFMSWLGMRVLPSEIRKKSEVEGKSVVYMDILRSDNVIVFDVLQPPRSPLLKYNMKCGEQLQTLLKGYHKFEEYIGYSFRDKGYLLQAFTHASYATNTLTDCYQRLEFLGDAILDYVITRHLYEDKRQHSPGSLTDLRSALVNNTIFASLAVKHGFHLYFRHSSPGLTTVLQKFVTFQEEHAHTLTPDNYLMGEEECDEAEDIEVPKALGDVFESVAGAIFLDSGMSLDAVWSVYYRIMKDEIEQFSQNVPKSPIRELLELEPETAKFSKPEKLWDGRRVRVTVEIIGVGIFRGIGRNYRIAKCTAAKCALRQLRRLKLTKTRGKV